MTLKQVERIIKKVRKMYQFDPHINNVLLHKASIKFDENEDGNLILSSITFDYYDYIIIDKTKIIYKEHDSYRGFEVLMKYKNWEELLKR